MFRTARTTALLVIICWQVLAAAPAKSSAQVVTTFVPAAPVVSFVPVRRGLFGLRTGFRPVVSFPAAVPMATFVSATPVTVWSPIVGQPVTTWRPMSVAPTTTVVRRVFVGQPVTTWHPTTVASPVTTTFFAPSAPVASWWTPAFP